MPDYARFSPQQLVVACRQGDEAAWQALVKRYERLVYTIPLRYGLATADADDVFQIVWLQLLHHLPHLKEPDRVSAWLVTTAKRACWDRRRGAEYERSVTVDPDHLPEGNGVDELSVEEIVTQHEQHTALRRAMAQLGQQCQGLLGLLYGASQIAYADIAAKLQIPIGAIGPTRARCLQKLRQLLEKM